jgi:type II secretory pathway component PulK
MTAASDTGAEPDDASGYFTVRIDDETGLYNLNRLSTHPTPDEYERLMRLFRLAGADAALVGPIVDWVDADSTPLAFPPGAESSQYAAEDRETPPRNAPLATFRELGLVLGVDAEALRALRKVTTVLPVLASQHEGSPGAAQRDRINVNTAPVPVLQALSAAFDDEALLGALHAERCVRPFLDEKDLRARVPGIEPVLSRLTYASQWYRVRATAHVGDSVQSVEALLFRNGARVDAAYLLSQRGANIAEPDEQDAASALGAGFELPTVTLKEPS